jgi:hypothetical protein
MYRFIVALVAVIVALTGLTGCEYNYPPAAAAPFTPAPDDPRFGFVEGTVEEIKTVEASLTPTTIAGKYSYSASVRIVPGKLLLKVSRTTDKKIYVLEVVDGAFHGPEALSMLLHPGSIVRFPTQTYPQGYRQWLRVFSDDGIGRISTDLVDILK